MARKLGLHPSLLPRCCLVLPRRRGRHVLNRSIQKLEHWLFSRRLLVLGALAILTAVMAFFALQLRMDAGFEKQIPIGHEYVKTFQQYRADLFGANRLTVVVKAKHGTIWTREGITRLYKVTQ